MQLKKKAPKKKARKAFHKRATSSSLEALAKSKMPKWRVAEGSSQDSRASAEADAVSPNLGELRTGTAAVESRKFRATVGGTSSDAASKSKKKSGLVNMVPESEEDARLGVKTQVFEDDEHTGSQG